MSKKVKRYNFYVDKFGSPRAYESEHGRWMKGADYDALLAERQWISVEERMPPPGETVMVYSPPEPGDHPGDVRISFDAIDPESDGDYWIAHGEHYEHWCCIAKGGNDIDWHGPSEKAPYTHWMSLPAPPVSQGDQQ